jgi:hypothetical protein
MRRTVPGLLVVTVWLLSEGAAAQQRTFFDLPRVVDLSNDREPSPNGFLRFEGELPPPLAGKDHLEVLAVAPAARTHAERAQTLQSQSLVCLLAGVGAFAVGGATSLALATMLPESPSRPQVIGVFVPLMAGALLFAVAAILPITWQDEFREALDLAVFHYNRDPQVRRF